MRSAGNFSPEWGYLAPAPSFMRTARIVVVATAIGATAGAGVVLSLRRPPGGRRRQNITGRGACDRHQRTGRHRPRHDGADGFGAGDRRCPDEHRYDCTGGAG